MPPDPIDANPQSHDQLPSQADFDASHQAATAKMGENLKTLARGPHTDGGILPPPAPPGYNDVPAANAGPPPAPAGYADLPAPSGAGGEQPSAFSRFVSSAASFLPTPGHLLSGIQEWWNKPAEIGKAMDALHVLNKAASLPENKGKPPAQWKEPDYTADEKSVIERGLNANLGSTEGQHPLLAPATQATSQAMQGDFAGAAGSLTGGYVVPAAAGAAVEAAPAAASAVVKHALPVVKAATSPLAQDVAGVVPGVGPSVAHGMSLVRRAITTGEKIADVVQKPGSAPVAAAPTRRVGAPAALPPDQMRTPRPPEPMPDLPRRAAPAQPAAAPAQAPAAAPQVTKIPAAGESAPSQDFASDARTAKVKTFADTLEDQLAPEQAARMSTSDWQRLSKGLGINAPSSTTVSAVVDELKARAAAKSSPTVMTPSADLLNALKKPGALTAAEAFAQAMGR